jgi:hypothetical protein
MKQSSETKSSNLSAKVRVSKPTLDKDKVSKNVSQSIADMNVNLEVSISSNNKYFSNKV